MNDMPKTIDAYLIALRRAFGNAPPGLVADALADAEEHLRNALAAHPGQSEAEAIGNYGSAADVAAEYLASETRPTGPFTPPPAVITAAAHRPLPGFFAVVTDPVTYGALLYMVLAGVTGIFYFAWASVGISLSLGLAILIIGVPFFLVFVGSVRMLSHIEGRIIEILLGVRMPRRLPVTAPDLPLRQRIREVLRDPRTWSSIVYMLLMLPLGLSYGLAAVLGLFAPLLLIYLGLWFLLNMGSVTLLGAQEPGCADCVRSGFHFHEAGGGMHLHNTLFPWLDSLLLSPVMPLMLILAAMLIFFLLLHLARLIGWLHGRIAERLLVRL